MNCLARLEKVQNDGKDSGSVLSPLILAEKTQKDDVPSDAPIKQDLRSGFYC